tara:strand:- start:554 stop:868 length:315 start_codon:yes stop_codon:yes gene_type:complete
MSNLRQREKAIKDLAMYFAEKGEILSQADYIKADDKPVPFSGVRRVFRSYSRMVDMLKRNQPELLELASKKMEPEVQAPKFKVPTFKVQPKVAVKPTMVVAEDK